MSDGDTERRHVFISHHHKDDVGVNGMTKLLGDAGCDIRNSSIRALRPENQERMKNGMVKDETIRRWLRAKISWAGAVVVLIGKETHTRQWVNWEIQEAMRQGKRIIGVWEHGGTDADLPPSLKDYADAVVGWRADRIMDAIDGKINNWTTPDGNEFRVAQFPASHVSKAGGTPLKLYSYVVARDFGFAPNPFHAYCTLATCKPKIRAKAQVGDWIIGTGSKKLGLEGHLIYLMRVSEVTTYDKYWKDERFRNKRPYLHGSLKQAYGDNIYHRDAKTKQWVQADSHHSFEGGLANDANVSQDTGSENVLIAEEFYFFGGSAPEIPERFRDWSGNSVCKKGPSHKCTFPDDLVVSFLKWVRSLGLLGYVGDPAQFRSDNA